MATTPAWAFDHVPGCPGKRIGSGFGFTEGPVWLPADVAALNGLGESAGLYFSDIDADTTYFGTREGVDVVRRPSGRSNGNALDASRRLISCEHDGRRVARNVASSAVDGRWDTVVGSFDGRTLNSPNDLCCRTDGVIFFTDPPYGVDAGNREIEFQGVFAQAGPLGTVLVDGMCSKPNGVALDPRFDDVVWVADTERGEIIRYRLACDLTVIESDSTSGFDRPDGLVFDHDDHLLVAEMNGVSMMPATDTADGADARRRRLIIEMEERPANLCIAGDWLFVCARTSVWRFLWPTDRPLVAAGDVARSV